MPVLFLPLLVNAQSTVSQLPPLVKANVPPNVFYTLDDSGSMMFEIMPELFSPTGKSSTDTITKNISGTNRTWTRTTTSLDYCYPSNSCWVSWMFPQPLNVYNVSGAGNYSNALSTVVGFGNNITVARMRSSSFNTIYYNPATRYDPWIDSGSFNTTTPYGKKMAAANSKAALWNPVAPTGGSNSASIDLTVNNTVTAYWLDDDAAGSTSKSVTFYPATYYVYNKNSSGSCTPDQLSCFTLVQVIATTATYDRATTRTDCASQTVCTYAEEIQNFANWFQYYRSRILLARGATGDAFSKQISTLRVGFGTINYSGVIVNRVSDDFSYANKQSFLSTFYTYRMPANGTSSRQALDAVGQYFSEGNSTYKGITGPWQTNYNVAGTQATCRQNYNLFMTDGYWNGTAAGSGRTGDWDGKNGTTKTSADGSTFTYTAGPPYKDLFSDTLADIAMYYWVNDLRTDMVNNVPLPPLKSDGTKSDEAFWQHLVQFTVGLGVKGTLDPATDLPALTAGTKSWPDGSTNQIDDLWHAAVNSRGQFFSATNPNEFASALDSALNTIAARTGDAAAVATSNNTLGANVKLYTSAYRTGDWSGKLEQKSIDQTTGAVTTTDWSTDTTLVYSGSRKIFSSAATGVGGIDFQYLNIAVTDKTAMDTAAASYAPGTVVSGVNLFDYLRGDKSFEGKPFRRRTYLLGDLVNSDPQFVQVGKDDGYVFLPSGSLGKTTYQTFLTNKKSRAPTVYVGANDGMLHAFDAETGGGQERFAFVPKTVIQNMPNLAKSNYVHQFFVDGTVNIGDAAIGADVNAPWKSVLVGGLGAGGKAVYAIDVTDPTTVTKDSVLWEISSTMPSTDNDLGYTFGVPQIGRLKDGTWVAVFGNGYSSGSGKAILYVVNLKTGAVLKKVDTGTVSNGLSTPKLLLDVDATIKAAYAGDIQGNLWKFDFTTAYPSPTNVTVALSGLPLFIATDAVNGSGRRQPITTQPQIYPHTLNGSVIVFGTGKIYEDTDPTTSYVETLYGVWDKATSVQVAKTSLVQQTLVKSGSFYAIPNPVAVDYTTKSGWYISMNVTTGERLVTDPIILEDQVIFTTLVPGVSTDPCVIDGLSTTIQLSPLNGAPLSYKTIDTNGDGAVTTADTMVSGRQTTATFGTTIVNTGDRGIKIYQAASNGGGILGPAGGSPGFDGKKSDAVPTVRLWRQILGTIK
jgi:type IV pilus assembly protein PilY1